MRRRVASPTETQSLPLMTIGSITGQLPAERTCSVRPAGDTRARQTCPARRELAGQPAGLPVCTCVPHVPRLSGCCSGTDFVSIPLGDGDLALRGAWGPLPNSRAVEPKQRVQFLVRTLTRCAGRCSHSWALMAPGTPDVWRVPARLMLNTCLPSGGLEPRYAPGRVCPGAQPLTKPLARGL